MIEDAFPGHKIEIESFVNDSFVPCFRIICDGKRLTATWSKELLTDLGNLHGVDGMAEFVNVMILEIKSELSRS
jgi:hypothetical protein